MQFFYIVSWNKTTKWMINNVREFIQYVQHHILVSTSTCTATESLVPQFHNKEIWLLATGAGLNE